MGENIQKITYKVDVLYKSNTFLEKSQPENGIDCLHIGISVNNPLHSGIKFKTLLEWTLERFSNVHINVHDSLQYHNFLITDHCSIEQAHVLAVKEGDNWLTKNREILSAFPTIKVFRRDAIIKRNSQYTVRLTQLKDLYKSSALFCELIDKETGTFLTRKEKKEGPWSDNLRKIIKYHSTEYVLDELALMSLLNERENFVEIYAGSFLNILKDPLRHEVKCLPEGLKTYPLIEVDFVRKPSTSLSQEAA